MNKQILKLAIPSILANVTIPLVGLVDTAIVGHLSNAIAIGGIAVGTMLFDWLYWNFGFLRVSTSGLTSQSYGRGEREECSGFLYRSLRIALIAAIGILLIQWFFVTAVLYIVPCSEEVADFAREYFFIRIWASPAALSLMAFKGWFIGMQDTVSPMATDITVNVVNIVASCALAFWTPLGVMGVAYGTVIAQYTGLMLAFGILWTKYREYHPFRKEERQVRGDVSLFSLNMNLFIRSLCFMIIYIGFTMLASYYGDVELAVSAIIMKIMMFFSYFVDGFAYAGEALVGKQIGEGKSTKEVVRLLFVWSIGVGLLFTGIHALWADKCIALLTSDGEVLETAQRYYGWLVAMPIVSTLAFMWDGVYIGAAEGVKIRNAMIWSAGSFVAVYLGGFTWLGIQALYMAYFAHLIARVVYLSIGWRR